MIVLLLMRGMMILCVRPRFVPLTSHPNIHFGAADAAALHAANFQAHVESSGGIQRGYGLLE